MKPELNIEKPEKKYQKLFYITPKNASFISNYAAKKGISKSALVNAIIELFRKEK